MLKLQDSYLQDINIFIGYLQIKSKNQNKPKMFI